ncbi:hypothetical protein L6164_024600 [Bauhinia variegata]|uniref:Uncharacterized protein n=1 Tax=Bauhinia variegata TaxID=167791 RepID=A0ACB9LZJ4_BAUVA|nr:hypothetical protein L6164_024600 [Bauhinia variegata]
MASPSSFDRWEKDPFFTAAEEVQESADRMESTYRTWIHAKKDSSSTWDSDELYRDLHTALGTTKWQLEEFERAVRSSYGKSSSDDARNRHRDFVAAIQDKITKVEHSLQESILSDGKASLPWVRLDEGERNELALFLSGMPAVEGKSAESNSRDNDTPQLTDKDSVSNCSKNLPLPSELSSMEARVEKSLGHRRTASASADIGSWKIAVFDDVQQWSSSNGPSGSVHKVPSFSGFFSSMEPVPKLKWPKNGFRKLRVMDHHQEAENALLPSTELSKGINDCYERSKSCLDGSDEFYNKQIYGWYGAIQRQLQRSQYQMQYRRPVQIAVWIVLLLCLIVLIAFRAM